MLSLVRYYILCRTKYGFSLTYGGNAEAQPERLSEANTSWCFPSHTVGVKYPPLHNTLSWRSILNSNSLQTNHTHYRSYNYPITRVSYSVII